AATAEFDDLPDDQKVAGEIETRDHRELVVELRAYAWRDRAVAPPGTRLRKRTKMTDRRLTGRQRKHGEAIAEVREREPTTLCDAARAPHRLGQVSEERRHFRRRFQMTLGISQEAPPGAVERRLGADAAEDVEELALGWRRVPYVV